MKQKAPITTKSKPQHGFALISTISIMSLLIVIALGMLSLSNITTQTSSANNAQLRADANARVALMLAISELQEIAGDDRRITANGSILDESSPNPNALGVWESWSPNLSKSTRDISAPDYDQEKESRFLRWLVSGNEEDLSALEWASSEPTGEQINLFGEQHDGFDLTGELITTINNNNEDGYAWAISQENTKAKINVAGPELASGEDEGRAPNDDIQVQPRPNLALSDVFTQPEGGWNQRAAKLIDYRQASLDEELGAEEGSISAGADFTTTSFGLLTNVVDGGLKVDMSLGFEMDEGDYNQSSWTNDGQTIKNPFHSDTETEFAVPESYQTQRPIFQPITDSGSLSETRAWNGARWDDQVHSYFPVTAVPTFNTLRSFYRIPHHLYETTENGVTIFERASDHIAAGEGQIEANFDPPPHIHAKGDTTQMGIRPILDRVIFVFSLSLTDQNTPTYAITPIVSLWNPYNVALEIEGAVAYPWLDLAIFRRMQGTHGGNKLFNPRRRYISNDLQNGNGARQIPPYILAAITADGNPISGTPTPINFKPGEVRIFAPSSPIPQTLTASGASMRTRTTFLKPIDSLADYNVTGGFNMTLQNDDYDDFVMKSGDFAQLIFEPDTGDPLYPIALGLSDSYFAKGNPANDDRGNAIMDVFATTFIADADANGENLGTVSRQIQFNELRNGGNITPVPVFTIEVYHRVTDSDDPSEINTDIMYTGNPRQSSMNSFVTKADFQTSPQYKIRLRAIDGADDVLNVDVSDEGRVSAFYGSSQSSSTGRNFLSFFEVPREPLLSLAALQHADLSPTPYSPANQFGNSWASAYVPRETVVDGAEGLEIDHCYLLNESLWDGFFFSGAAPELSQTDGSGSAANWDNPIANEEKSLSNVIQEFAEDSSANPLRNSRMQLRLDSLNGMNSSEFATAMTQPEACTLIAGHLLLDGSFNVNSTSVNAWKAMLAGLKGSSLDIDGSSESISDTPFPRFRNPMGEENDKWHGFRSLTDEQIDNLATEIVNQVRLRGPFLSLGEFINRQVTSGDLGLSGALQTAIDATSSINENALEKSFDLDNYDASESSNISPPDTGVGIPGYLTQADVLQSIAPILTVRSDTFTIRTYGEARDNNGNVTAKSWIEATIQRLPEFVDNSDSFDTQTSDLSETNQEFGRKFHIVSFRYLGAKEAELLDSSS